MYGHMTARLERWGRVGWLGKKVDIYIIYYHVLRHCYIITKAVNVLLPSLARARFRTSRARLLSDGGDNSYRVS